MWWKLLLIALVVVACAATLASWSYQQGGREAEVAWNDVAARASPSLVTFEPAMVSDLPEIARRDFNHTISVGTPLHTTVRIEMEGAFLLGDRASFQAYAMIARQILSPPSEFVWVPVMRSGAMRISGSDALVHGVGWTRFWINGLVPVVNLQDSPDLNRSAQARAAMESVWAPASLLPAHGVAWEQTRPNTARLTFGTGVEPVDLTLAADGRVREVVTMRWSDVNADRTFRLQPFGGTMDAEQTFGGYTIPSKLKVGNLYGSANYLPFFQARITAADFL